MTTTPPAPSIPSWSRPPPSLTFDEHQHGFFAPVDVASTATDDEDMNLDLGVFESGYELGLDVGSSLDFTVQIGYGDLTSVLADPAVAAPMSGSVIAPALSDRALTVTGGQFVLLHPDPTRVETSHMQYWLDIRSVDGAGYQIFGFKVIHEGPEWAAWPDSTTLYITVRHRGGPHDGEVMGRGISRVSLGGFADLLRSMRVGNVAGRWDRLRYETRFGQVLGRALFKHYGGSFAELNRFPKLPIVTHIPTPRNRGLDEPLTLLRGSSRGWFPAPKAPIPDDVVSRLIRYTRQDTLTHGPVVLAPGFGMPSWSLGTHTIDRNLVEYLIDEGFEVWLFDYHSGSDLPSAKQQFTLDVLADDWVEAIPEVMAQTKTGHRGGVQCVAHCVGSASLLIALLRGMPGVERAVCGQYTLFPYGSTLNLVKNHLGVGELLAASHLTDLEPDTAETIANVALDLLLRPIPIPAGERCGQSVCRWINAIYGLTHTHSQLNEDTHNLIGDIFGVANLTSLRHIGLTMTSHELVDASGATYVTPANARRLTMPIHFLAGMRNYIFPPKGTRETLKFLRREGAGPNLYTADFLAQYSHLDTMIGRNAERDVFGKIRSHLSPAPPP